jgi:hypothetical protein
VNDAKELTRQSRALGDFWGSMIEFLKVSVGIFGLF